MLVVRPIELKDLAAFEQLAVNSGLTNLPPDKKFLENKIRLSIKSFNQLARGGTYCFVLEDTENKKIVGTSSIMDEVGRDQPFYNFILTDLFLSSNQLAIENKIQILQLSHNLSDTSELCGFYIQPSYRNHHNGKLLSFSRLLFIYLYQQYFANELISEIRGVCDESGCSPFWEAVGKQFFKISFAQADQLTGTGNKDFIKDLMPPISIIINLLPLEAQQVIGLAHAQSKAAVKLLEEQGFEKSHYVDIFDAGPVYTSSKNKVDIIQHAKHVKIVDINESNVLKQECLLVRVKPSFRVVHTFIAMKNEQEIGIAKELAQFLELNLSEEVVIYKMSDI